MIYPKKRLQVLSVPMKAIDYTSFASGMNTEVDENLLPHKVASLAFNYSSKSGALCSGIGFRDLHLPNKFSPTGERKIIHETISGFTGIWQLRFFSNITNERCDSLIVLTDEKAFKACQLFDISQYLDPIVVQEFQSIPSVINYRLNGEDILILASPKDDLTVWYPDTATVQPTFPNAPRILSCCLHYERLFAIDALKPDRLWFSDDLDPTNWNISLDDAGYIEMVDERGLMQKVISFMDYVFVFRDFGIAKISAYGEQANFSVSQLFTSSGKISSGSISICGDKILFLARDGLHYFNGTSADKITLGIESLFSGITNESTSSAYLEGKYYLACKMNFGDDMLVGCESYENGYTNNALLVLDINSGEYEVIRGVDIAGMTALQCGTLSKIALCFNGEYASKLGEITTGGMLFDEPLKKVWRSPKSNLGFPSRKKIVKEILVQSLYDITVEVNCDGIVKTFAVKGKNGASKIFPKMKGEIVQISFISCLANAKISRPQIVFGVL
ncbi:MAG: hypothetical protein WCR30_02915 [Clostridia bacterium]